jgi:hypothetical protein
VIVVVAALGGGLFDGAVHPLDLAVRRANSPPDCWLILLTPMMVGLGEPVLDAVGFADHVEAAHARKDGVAVPRLLGELDAVVREQRVDPVRDRLQQFLEKLAGRRSGGLAVEPRQRLAIHAAHPA